MVKEHVPGDIHEKASDLDKINIEIPDFIKFYNFIESLKANKDIKDLLHYVGEHVLPVLEKKQDQKVLEILDIKCS